MKKIHFLFKIIIIVASLVISVAAITYSEWLWSAYFIINVIDRCSKLKEEA